MEKSEVYQIELAKLEEIFKDIDPAKAKLVEGLIQDAAFIKAENYVLKEQIKVTGMVRINPRNPLQQEAIETGKQYLKNINSYAVVIKALSSVLTKNIVDDGDELDEFE